MRIIPSFLIVISIFMLSITTVFAHDYHETSFQEVLHTKSHVFTSNDNFKLLGPKFKSSETILKAKNAFSHPNYRNLVILEDVETTLSPYDVSLVYDHEQDYRFCYIQTLQREIRLKSFKPKWYKLSRYQSKISRTNFPDYSTMQNKFQHFGFYNLKNLLKDVGKFG